MKRLVIAVVTAVSVVVGPAPAAFSGERADTYYTVFCDGVAYESVDANAVDRGGYAIALSLFPRADCVLAGPFGG